MALSLLSRLLINGLAIIRFQYREYLNDFDGIATRYNVRSLNILVLITLNIRLSRVTRACPRTSHDIVLCRIVANQRHMNTLPVARDTLT